MPRFRVFGQVRYISFVFRSPKMFRYAFYILNRGAPFLPVIISPESPPRLIIGEANEFARSAKISRGNKDSFLKSSEGKFWPMVQVTIGNGVLKGRYSLDGNTVTIGGDLITAINGTRIINTDDLSTYLQENTLPNQKINITIIRNGITMNIPTVLGTRPPPS